MKLNQSILNKKLVVGLVRNLPNLMLYTFLKVAEKLQLLSFIYPQLKNQPNLPKLVTTLETEIRKAHLPMHCVMVDIEQTFIFFHLRPLIDTTKQKLEIIVKELIRCQKLPMNTFVRRKNNMFVVLIERDWILEEFPTI